VTNSHGQTQYQVRFDWGLEGADAIARDVDVIVVVDVLSFGTTVDLAVSQGAEVVANGSRVVAALSGYGAAVVVASLRNRTAVAAWVLAQQGDKGDRFFVAIIAAGEQRDDGTTRFAVEDLLGAGAVIDALAEVGVDYCSPESAAAAAAFTGLRNATGHLIGASASGRELAGEGYRGDIDLAIEVDVSSTVPVLDDNGVLVAAR
jgi:2-phosphosulfolactate phosphatase